MESGAEQITIWTLFLEADPVVKGVMLILAVASIWSWAVAVDKWLQFGDLEAHARKFEREFWSGRSIDDLDERAGVVVQRRAVVHEVAHGQVAEQDLPATNQIEEVIVGEAGKRSARIVETEQPHREEDEQADGPGGHAANGRQRALGHDRMIAAALRVDSARGFGRESSR